jgi:hypothetical protein
MDQPSSTPVVVASGTPRQLGLAHGEGARDLVREAADRWREHVGRGLPIGIDDYVTEMVEGAGFVRAVEKWSPDLLDEVRGIADGAGLDWRLVFAMNLLDEEWWFRTRFTPEPAGEHCSGLGIRPGPGQPAIAAQNMDLGSWRHGLQLLLDLRPDIGPATLVATVAGVIGLNGLNQHGIGVCENTLAELPSDDGGLPVAFVLRSTVAQPTLQAAVETLTSVSHASGQNYIVGSPEDVVDVECSAGGAVPLVTDARRFGHTNHVIAGHPEGDVDASLHERLENSRQRLAHVEAGLSTRQEPVTTEQVGQLLAEQPLCRGGGDDPGFSLYSVVMTCTEQPRMLLTAGPPSAYPYVEYAVAGTGACA